jgi:hypothetical protein
VLALELLEDRSLPSVTIQGSVFVDANANGIRDTGESNLAQAGITVWLDQNHNGVLDAGEVSTTTQADGTYQFTGLAPGTYTVAQQAPSGWTQTAPAPTPSSGTLGQTLKEIPAPDPASPGLAWANGYLYVEGYEAGNTIYQVDPATGNVLSHFNLPSTVSGNGLAFDGTNFWTTHFNSHQVVEFNSSSTILQQFASPGSFPTGITWDSGSQTLWVADLNTNTLYNMNTSGQVLKTLASPETQVRGLVMANGQLWATSGSNGKLFAVDPNTGVEVQSLVAPSAIGGQNYPYGLAFDGQSLWLSRIQISNYGPFPNRLLQVTLSEPSEQTVTVADGGSATVDFGDFQLGTITGQVSQSSSAGPVGGDRVYVDANGNGVFDLWERSTLTDANGNYSLAGLPPGTYTVMQDLRQPGWAETGTTSYTVSITTSGQTVSGNNFSIQQNAFGPVGPEFRANTTSGEQSFGPKSIGQHLPSGAENTAMDSQGNFVVVWQGNGSGDSTGIFGQLYYANSTPNGGEFRVNSATTNTHSTPVVAMAPNGTFAVAWSTLNPTSNTYSVWARSFSASGAPLSGDVEVSGGSSVNFVPSAIAMNNSNYVVLYQGSKKYTAGYIFFQRYTSSGSAVGGAVQVVQASLVNGGSSMGMDANGNLVASWTDSVNPGTFAQRYNSSGKKVGSVIPLSLGAISADVTTSLAMNATGAFVVTGNTDFQIFNSSGVAQSPVVTFNGNLPSGGAYTQSTAVQWRPGVAIDSAGNVMLTWDDGANVKARQYSANGTPQGNPFVVGALVPGSGSYPAVAINRNTTTNVVTAVVAWAGSGPGDDNGVFAQRYQSRAGQQPAGGPAAPAGQAVWAPTRGRELRASTGRTSTAAAPRLVGTAPASTAVGDPLVGQGADLGLLQAIAILVADQNATAPGHLRS